VRNKRGGRRGWVGTRSPALVAGCYGVRETAAVSKYAWRRRIGGGRSERRAEGSHIRLTFQTTTLATASSTQFEYFDYDALHFERYSCIFLARYLWVVQRIPHFHLHGCVAEGHVFMSRSFRPNVDSVDDNGPSFARPRTKIENRSFGNQTRTSRVSPASYGAHAGAVLRPFLCFK